MQLEQNPQFHSQEAQRANEHSDVQVLIRLRAFPPEAFYGWSDYGYQRLIRAIDVAIENTLPFTIAYTQLITVWAAEATRKNGESIADIDALIAAARIPEPVEEEQRELPVPTVSHKKLQKPRKPRTSKVIEPQQLAEAAVEPDQAHDLVKAPTVPADEGDTQYVEPEPAEEQPQEPVAEPSLEFVLANGNRITGVAAIVYELFREKNGTYVMIHRSDIFERLRSRGINPLEVSLQNIFAQINAALNPNPLITEFQGSKESWYCKVNLRQTYESTPVQQAPQEARVAGKIEPFRTLFVGEPEKYLREMLAQALAQYPNGAFATDIAARLSVDVTQKGIAMENEKAPIVRILNELLRPGQGRLYSIARLEGLHMSPAQIAVVLFLSHRSRTHVNTQAISIVQAAVEEILPQQK